MPIFCCQVFKLLPAKFHIWIFSTFYWKYMYTLSIVGYHQSNCINVWAGLALSWRQRLIILLLMDEQIWLYMDKRTLTAEPTFWFLQVQPWPSYNFDFEGQMIEFNQNCCNCIINGQILLIFWQNQQSDFSKYDLDLHMTFTVKVKLLN